MPDVASAEPELDCVVPTVNSPAKVPGPLFSFMVFPILTTQDPWAANGAKIIAAINSVARTANFPLRIPNIMHFRNKIVRTLNA